MTKPKPQPPATPGAKRANPPCQTDGPAAVKNAKATEPNPVPTSAEEFQARKLALEGIRFLRRAYSMSNYRVYDVPDEDGPLKFAGPWGEAYAKVCDAVGELFAFAGCGGPDAYCEAEKAVCKLEAAEAEAKRAAQRARRKARMAAKKGNA